MWRPDIRWRDEVWQYRRRVKEVRAQLDRDAEFHDSLPLRVRDERWYAPVRLAADWPAFFSIVGVGLAGEAGSVKCSAETHAAWLDAARAYVAAVDAATEEAIAAYERFAAASGRRGTWALPWRMREVREVWEQAQQDFSTAVRAAEEAYQPVREAVLAAAEELRREWAAGDAERLRKCRELAERAVWGIDVFGEEGATREVYVHRHDLEPDYRPEGTGERQPPPADVPMTARALEAVLADLHAWGAAVHWTSAAKKAVRRETGLALKGWWTVVFPRSRLFWSKPPLGASGSTYTGTTHHTSYGGGHSCAFGSHGCGASV